MSYAETHGIYIGPDEYKRGSGALLLIETLATTGKRTGKCKAQFDDLKKFRMHETHAWVEYPLKHFKVDRGNHA
jgi:hypothetical protein